MLKNSLKELVPPFAPNLKRCPEASSLSSGKFCTTSYSSHYISPQEKFAS